MDLIFKKDFFFDFETRSRKDLTKVGGVNYALDDSTQATAISYCIGNGPIRGWDRWSNSPIPYELDDVKKNPHHYNFIAWNIEFDYLIWSFCFWKNDKDFVRPKVADMTDAMGISNYFRLGSTLEANASMLNLPLRKDKKGRAVMMKLAKPNARGEFVDPTPEELHHFKNYYMGDTNILRMSYNIMPKLPAKERRVWEWTINRNLQGVKVDTDLLKAFEIVMGENIPPLAERFKEIVGCSHNSPFMKDWFKQFYPWIVDFKKETVEELLMDSTPVPEYVREALDIKYLLAGVALSKVSVGNLVQRNGRLYQLFDFAKAQNKRFAGRGIQPQNFPRFDKKRRDKIEFDLESQNLAGQFLREYPNMIDPLGCIKNLLRRIWKADDTFKFIAGDFSKIEPTVLFWLLDMGPIPGKWYEEMASEIYKISMDQIGKDSDERQVGKSAQLSCGYGSGGKAFRVKTFQDTGILLSPKLADETVKAYRRKYPLVVKFWDDLEEAFFLASNVSKRTELCRGRVIVMPMPAPWKGVMIELPDGSKLYYHNTQVREMIFKKKVTEIDENGVKSIKDVVEKKYSMSYIEPLSTGALKPKSVYGGLLCVAEGTKVLTKDGWKNIELVSNKDILWDGEEWVGCDGNIFNGVKETIEAYGARFTPDHLILTEKGWKDASQSKRYIRASCRIPDGYRIPRVKREKVYLENAMRLWQRKANAVYRVFKEAKIELSSLMRLPKDRVSLKKTNFAWAKSFSNVCGVEGNESKVYQSKTSGMEKLWRQGDICLPRVASKFRELLARYAGGVFERTKLRPYRQRQGILQRELSVGDNERAEQQQKVFQKVYDIVNCGPRNRFVVIAGGEPLIVHNCENVVSCIARQIMVEAILRIEDNHIPCLGSVHDEAWGLIKAWQEQHFVDIMSVTPSWAVGLKVVTEAQSGIRYVK